MAAETWETAPVQEEGYTSEWSSVGDLFLCLYQEDNLGSMRSIPNDRSGRHTECVDSGSMLLYFNDKWRWGGGGGGEWIQLLFANTQGSINLSPGQVWVSWGERRPHRPSVLPHTS